jgi:integration host factor subunit alpha
MSQPRAQGTLDYSTDGASGQSGSSASRAEADRRNVRTLTKAELADALFERLGLNKREAKDMVEGFFDEIRAALERGDSVKLSGFGNFQVRSKPQRPGRNPKTGEEIAITARRVVTFHASQKLKAAVSDLPEMRELPGMG